MKDTAKPAAAVTVKVANWLAVIAAASVVLIKLLPPHARAAPVPLTPTPGPRVRPPTVKCGSLLVAASGDVPKLFAPPGCGLTSHAASVAAPALRAAGPAASSSNATPKPVRRPSLPAPDPTRRSFLERTREDPTKIDI